MFISGGFKTKITQQKDYAVPKQLNFSDIELVLEPQKYRFNHDQEPGFESHSAGKCSRKRKCIICERIMNSNNMVIHMAKVH